MLRGRRIALLSLVAVLGIVGVIAIPTAPAAPRTQAAKPAKLTVGLAVLRFSTNGNTLHAKGVVIATLIDQAGNKQTIRTPVAMTAQAGGRCRILQLVLNKLHLSLLGLNVDLSKVNLRITGAPHGGPLGSLFCSLAKAHLASARA